MAPVSPVFPIDIAESWLTTRKLVPQFTPPGPNLVYAPGTEGGGNYGPVAYSRQTGLLYVNAIDNPMNGGRPARGYFSAFQPATGELVWQRTFEGWGQGGPVVTAGGVAFVGSGSNTAGYFMAYDARTGDLLWKFNTGSGIFSSPAVYAVRGEQFVTVASGGGERGRRGGDLILSFALARE
jgi:alcohol dehydrogenase (cytochrome c)